MRLFELGTTQAAQEEPSGSVPASEQKTASKKRAKCTARMSLPEELRREEVVIEQEESTEDFMQIG